MALSFADSFFYYGRNDLGEEIDADLRQGVVQPRRTLFYFRTYGAGLEGYENAPQSFALRVRLQYAILEFVARRNRRVSDGSGFGPDRRVVSSQNAVRVESGDGVGEINVSLLYVPLAEIESAESLEEATIRKYVHG